MKFETYINGRNIGGNHIENEKVFLLFNWIKVFKKQTQKNKVKAGISFIDKNAEYLGIAEELFCREIIRNLI